MSLCYWLSQHMSFLPHFLTQPYCLAADRQGQGDTRLTLTPSVIPNSNYVIMVSDWNCLKYFCVFVYCNRQVPRDLLITLYNTAHAHCMVDTQGCRHALRMCNTYRFSTATMVARKRLYAALCVHCLCLFFHVKAILAFRIYDIVPRAVVINQPWYSGLSASEL
jgi:hypothetical protein